MKSLPTFIRTTLLVILTGVATYSFAQQKVINKPLNYELMLPAGLFQTENDNDTFLIYIDTASELALMVSARETTFKDVNSYLDCSRKGLEEQLQKLQEDSTLKLVECRRSQYYPDQAVVLHIETKAYLPQFDRCLIYFIHQRKKEIQFFFLYRKGNSTKSLDYIDKVMATLNIPKPH